MPIKTILTAILATALGVSTISPVSASVPSFVTSHSPSSPVSAASDKARQVGGQTVLQLATPPSRAQLATALNRPTPIVGGTDTGIDQAPWQVALVDLSGASDYDAQYCAGSIIDESWILTAAHCVEGVSAEDIGVLSGVDYLDDVDYSYDNLSYADLLVTHEDYDTDLITNDIALIHLTDPLTLVAGVREVISLPTSSPAVGAYLRITGWGSTDSLGGGYPQQLQTSTQRIVSTSTCSSLYDGFSIATMLCVGVTPFLTTAVCDGDSGGPAAYISGGTATLVGLVSYGAAAGCAEGYPSVLTKVYAFTTWIAENMIDPVDPEEGVLDYAWLELEYPTVYPKSDGFKDTIDIYAHVVSTMGEGYEEPLGAGSKIVIKKGTVVVKTWTLSNSGDTYLTWNGKKGTAIVAGTYTATLTAYGMNGVAVTDTINIKVSSKKLVTKTWKKTKTGKLFSTYLSYDSTACQFYGTKIRVWTYGEEAICYGSIGLPESIQASYADAKLTVKLSVTKNDGDYCGAFIVTQATAGWKDICTRKTYTWNMGSLDTSDGVITANLWGSGDYAYTSYYASQIQFIIKFKKLE